MKAHFVPVLTLAAGVVTGSAGTAYYFSPRLARIERLLELSASTQQRLTSLNEACVRARESERRQARASEGPVSPVTPLLEGAEPAPGPLRTAADAGALTSQDLDNIAQAEDLLSGATKLGRWGSADRERLRALVRELPTPERHRLLLSLTGLLNDGKLKLTDIEEPF